MDTVLDRVRAELVAAADDSIREGGRRFFKEPIQCYGIKTATVTKIARSYYHEASADGKAALFDRCEDLFASGLMEESFIAGSWLPRLSGEFDREDLDRFARWIETYIDNWASCDTFCNHAVGDLVARFPDTARVLLDWTASPNRWMRRAAAVSLIIPAKHGGFLDEAFAIADRLLLDEDDLVRKGYGWLLKEASRHHRQEVFDYVLLHRRTMPRTALRYAIELMPPEMRREAMKKG